MSRCVQCSRTKADHTPDRGACSEFKSRDLPPTATCKDCAHFAPFCSKFIGPDIADNTTCDWYPIRFVPIWVPK